MMPELEMKGVVKSFDGFRALDGLDLSVEKGAVYGLVGPNGAGKTTAIKHLSGVYRQDAGEVLMEGKPIFENPESKSRLVCVSDDVFFFSQATLRDMMLFYQGIYPRFDELLYRKLGEVFPVEEGALIRRLSRGMQKQAMIRLAISAAPDVLILDEPMDGLDPVMRRQVWKLVLEQVAERELTVLVSSHNLREMEDVCDHVGILHKGRCLLQRSLSELQDNIVKVLIALPEGRELPEELHPLHDSLMGRLHTLILRGDAEENTRRLAELQPLYMDAVPLTLEDIFIYELGGADYAVKDILL
ncbi:MAG: ABC transporter ATP-binding protein [Oscillospiraceae bacterium]|nr:ABC transporter ATP-binding protein [Oscillospiraceae bacterium]